MSANHTPGPWAVNTAGSASAGQPFKIDEFYVYAPGTQDDVAICSDVIDPVTQEPSKANARRIVACVNACEGYDSSELELIAKHPSGLRAYSIETVAAITAQRDDLLKACRRAILALASACEKDANYRADYEDLARAIEAAHGITSK